MRLIFSVKLFGPEIRLGIYFAVLLLVKNQL